MSFSTYSDLQTQVANWLARSDLNAYIPDMIRLFEVAACRRLRVRPMEAVTSISTTSGVGTLPTDYLGYRRLTWVGTPRTELVYVSPPIFQSRNPYSDSGVPSVFTIEASSVKIASIDDTGLEMLYYQRTAALSGTLNWLYTNHFDAYLFGTLCEANAFKRGDGGFKEAALWKARRDEVFDEIKSVEFWERGPMAVKPVGVTP